MMKVDLHVHSKYSRKPTEWFLKRVGAAESYTEPEYIYKTLKNRGMNLVTITDHNTIKGALRLKEKYPDDTFISVESTAHFPEDDCKVHILIYDINEVLFEEIQRLRYNIYDLREFLINGGITHSVAHPVYSVNGRLTIAHIEKLLVLFNTFEGVNASRNENYNTEFVKIVSNLTKEKIDEFANKYKITPHGDSPHKKVFTGGSDDHSGLMMGKAFTFSEDADDLDGFLNDLKAGEIKFYGSSANFYNLAFNIYKIAYDYSLKNRVVAMTGSLLGNLIENIVENKQSSLWERIKLKRLKKKSSIHLMITDLLQEIKSIKEDDMQKRFEFVFDRISDISDELIRNIFKKLKKKGVSIDAIYRSIVAALPGVFISVPFFSSYRITYKDHDLIRALTRDFAKNEQINFKKIAWFTDTINDLNGVSVTIKAIGHQSARRGYPLRIYGSVNEEELSNELPPNFVNLPPIVDFKLPYYSHLKIKIPSMMKALKTISEETPDEIYISTPGPVGILGLIIGKLLNVKTIGIYHTDFTKEIYEISKDDSLSSLVERYVNFFYNNVSEVRPTSKQYLDMLKDRGVVNCAKVFRRGIDTDIFKPIYKFKDPNVINLIYAGRVSKDKNIDFLMDVYSAVAKRFSDLRVRLFIIGDGPYREKAENKYKHKGIYFLGKVKNSELPQYYNSGDLFLFPSNTDTFGMVVLEAQACALPAIVSDQGGPKEIIVDGVTGFVAKSNDLNDWVEKISTFIRWKLTNDPRIDSMKYEAHTNVKKFYDWECILKEVFVDA